MRFIKAQDGSAINVDHITQVGAANTIRGSKGFGDYLMVVLPNGRTAVPVDDTGAAWPADALDGFLKVLASV